MSRDICCWPALSSSMVALSCSISCRALASSFAIEPSDGAVSADGAAAAGATPCAVFSAAVLPAQGSAFAAVASTAGGAGCCAACAGFSSGSNARTRCGAHRAIMVSGRIAIGLPGDRSAARARCHHQRGREGACRLSARRQRLARDPHIADGGGAKRRIDRRNGRRPEEGRPRWGLADREDGAGCAPASKALHPWAPSRPHRARPRGHRADHRLASGSARSAWAAPYSVQRHGIARGRRISVR